MLLPVHLHKRFAHYNDSDFTLQRVMVQLPLSEDAKNEIRARRNMYDDILRPYIDAWEEANTRYNYGWSGLHAEELLKQVAKAEEAMIPHLENSLIAIKLERYIDTL